MSETVCVVNIGSKGRRQRAFVGIAMGLVVVAGLVLFARYDYPLFARLAFLIPLFLAGLGLFQAQAGT